MTQVVICIENGQNVGSYCVQTKDTIDNPWEARKLSREAQCNEWCDTGGNCIVKLTE